LAVPYIQFSLKQDAGSAYKQATTFVDNSLDQVKNGNKVSNRCRDNLYAMTFGYFMFEEFCHQIEADVLVEFDMCDVYGAMVDELMDGEQGAKSPLDEFVEICSVMAQLGELQEDKHYAIVEERTCIYPNVADHKNNLS
jgi:hypothetical protein